MIKNKKFIILFVILIVGGFFYFFSAKKTKELVQIYKNQESSVIQDRKNIILSTRPNSAGNISEYINDYPEKINGLIVKKEDKYFYYHPGINPVSTARAFFNMLRSNKNVTSSTINQQLVKVLLQNETNRNFKNKFKETVLAICLEIHLSKDEILNMYLNSIYMGNNIQGVNSASRYYFNLSPDLLTDEQIMKLLATINSPTERNPQIATNIDEAKKIAKNLDVEIESWDEDSYMKMENREEKYKKLINHKEFYEFTLLDLPDEQNSQVTVDIELTEKIRSILKANLNRLVQKDAINGAVVVIKNNQSLGDSELLAMVGTPDSEIDAYGYKINMATKSRPVGSTIKPLIYLKGFEKKLRPYTKIEDKEYKYIIDSGFAFYPKNYDYKYRGMVDLHYALSNSLNVPTVKVLEYVGIEEFNSFLIEDLELKPVQDIENYQLGIALGGLEVDLVSMAYYFSILANEGKLKPLHISNNGDSGFVLNAQTNLNQDKVIAHPEFIQLLNIILSDRKTGVEQFGMISNLNLPQDNYAVKTGTSREYHDSWTIGYTPDYIVGVWVGNYDDTAMDKVSGSTGAGAIWQEVMSLLLNSEYNKNTKFKFDLVQEFYNNENIEYGLKGDNYQEIINLLENNNLITAPHDRDIFLFDKNMQIPLHAVTNVQWQINNNFFGNGENAIFAPEQTGAYKIKATSPDGETELITIYIEKED